MIFTKTVEKRKIQLAKRIAKYERVIKYIKKSMNEAKLDLKMLRHEE